MAHLLLCWFVCVRLCVAQYYDGDSSPPGSPTLGQATFLWDVNGWPAVVDRM